MLRYTCKRLLMLIPIMLGVLIIIFAIRAITPAIRWTRSWARMPVRNSALLCPSSWA